LKYFIIPNHINIPEILKNNPPRKSDKHWEVCLKYIITIIINLSTENKEYVSEDGYVPLSTVILRRVMHNRYRDCLDYLIEVGIIELKSNGYMPGKLCKRYRLVNPVMDNEYALEEIRDEWLLNRINVSYNKDEAPKYLTKWFVDDLTINADLARQFVCENFQEDKRFLYHLCISKLESGDLTILRDETGRRVHNNLSMMKKELREHLSYDGNPLIGLDMKTTQPFFIASVILNPGFYSIDQFDIGSKLCFPPKTNNVRGAANDAILVDDSTNVTTFYPTNDIVGTLKSVAVPAHGESGIISNTAGGALSTRNLMAQSATWDSHYASFRIHDERENNNTRDEYIQEELRLVNLMYSYTLFSSSSYHPPFLHYVYENREQIRDISDDIIARLEEPDVKLFKEIVLQNDIYDSVINRFPSIKKENDEGEQRDAAKKVLWEILYSRLENRSAKTYEFKRVFPNVMFILNQFKHMAYIFPWYNPDRPHAVLAVMLQYIESTIFIDNVCMRISEEYPDLPIFTVHDSIITLKGEESKIQRIMEETIEELIGVRPTIRVE
jgi:hypothetical protein